MIVPPLYLVIIWDDEVENTRYDSLEKAEERIAGLKKMPRDSRPSFVLTDANDKVIENGKH